LADLLLLVFRYNITSALTFNRKAYRMEIERILLSQREFFATQQTKSIAFRKMYLEKLRSLIISNESILYEAISKDFGKSKFDTFYY
jgi:aldehyde dehydrogenase (NAD+)